MDAEEHTPLAMAVLVAALVKTLGEKDRTFVRAFRRNLEETAAASGGTGCSGMLDRVRRLLEDDETEADDPAWIVYAKPRDPDLVETLQHDPRVPVPTLAEALALWAKLPEHDRLGTVVETMSGRRLDPVEADRVLARMKPR